MAGKSKGKTNHKNERDGYQARQLRWLRIAFVVFALILILSMVLSQVAQQS
jgi:hypothetical protein